MSAKKDEVYAAIEIATSGVKLLVGYYFEGRVYVLHALQSTSTIDAEGGFADDPKQITVAVKEVIDSAQQQLNYKIEEVALCLPAIELEVSTETATTSTVGSDSVIDRSDINNVHNMIRKKVARTGKKIVSIIPVQYILDNNVSYKTLPPKAVTNSLTIEADCELIDETVYNTYKEAVEHAGVIVNCLLVSPYATVHLLESYDELPVQYTLVDIGARMTDVAIVIENRLLAHKIVPFGGEDIARYVAKEYGITTEAAHRYIEVYGISEDPTFDFKTADGFTVSSLNATIKKSLQILANHLNSTSVDFGLEELPDLILSGGTSNLYGIDGFLSEALTINVMVFTPKNFGARNKSYANLIGMIKYISLNPPKTLLQRKSNDFTLTRVNIQTNNATRGSKHVNDDESL